VDWQVLLGFVLFNVLLAVVLPRIVRRIEAKVTSLKFRLICSVIGVLASIGMILACLAFLPTIELRVTGIIAFCIPFMVFGVLGARAVFQSIVRAID